MNKNVAGKLMRMKSILTHEKDYLQFCSEFPKAKKSFGIFSNLTKIK